MPTTRASRQEKEDKNPHTGVWIQPLDQSSYHSQADARANSTGPVGETRQ